MRGEQFPILLAGGMLNAAYRGSPAEVARRLAEVAPRSVVAPLTAEPAIGAVRLALAEARGGVRVPPYIDSVRATRCSDRFNASMTKTRWPRRWPRALLDAIVAQPDARARACRPAARRWRCIASCATLSAGAAASTGRGCGRSTSTSLSALAAIDPGSYRAFMQEELFDHVPIDPANIDMLNGRAPDLEAECRRYEDAIAAAGGIDLQILGIGANGHIGFNEPADEPVRAHARRATLQRGDAAKPTRCGSAATGARCRSARCRWGWRRSSARARSC